MGRARAGGILSAWFAAAAGPLFRFRSVSVLQWSRKEGINTFHTQFRPVHTERFPPVTALRVCDAAPKNRLLPLFPEVFNMKDERKTKKQLIEELIELARKIRDEKWSD